MGPDVTESDTFWELTDVTLANEDTNSTPTDNANDVIQGNVAMQDMQTMQTAPPNFEPIQVVPSGGQISN